MIVKMPVADDFSLSNIIKYKPFFFFFGDAPIRTVLYKKKPVLLEFFQDGNYLEMKIDGDVDAEGVEFLKERVSYCLGINEEFSDFYTIVRDDKVLNCHYDSIYGNRLLSAFSDFEAAVCIICSQNVSFRQYKIIIGKIVDAYGEGVYFPEPGQILARPQILLKCGVGYRDKFIVDMCRYFRSKDKTDLMRMSEVLGFGPYSMDIFRLFQLRDYGYFYVDRLIKKIFKSAYRVDLLNDFEVRSFAKKKFGKFAGLAELYLQKFLCDNR
ncbi:MAG: hypothetical protein DRN71_01490 [Candidatus Nanohalarchaeota archaeon]|nr:MAG: hypothetical protein DRN71_01490 [Candidatus Nanohaloarchaeota archaeon]